MTLEDAMRVRYFNINDLSRRSGVSRPTIYSILGKRKKQKSSVRVDTLLKIAKALNAKIVINEKKTNGFDIILKEVKRDENS
jgi:transcriptional regulator with XRE-family HTH domain|nr:MAG TPA: Cro/C1-type HTH DNA-binding domain protein [Caudoviricetes sp.]DAX00019.1 MAG TPA: Cro/C1-type HTH DNA-binding domain protein [Bacteriophage sp.]DAY83979.1 MAG TPA: Cro/C1-type HTH DNA-binding domain protein [Caudoviricetes sp.]